MIRRRLNYLLCAVLPVFGLLLHPQMANGELAKSMVLESNVAYLRLAQTEKNLPDEIQSALDDLAATNKIAGIVLDLRFASGDDVDSLKPTEDILEQKKLPLAILVNSQTRGAAASLADDLREANAGLIFGGTATNLQPDIAVAVSANDEKSFLKTPYGVLTDNDTNSSTNFLPYVDIDRTTEADLVREKTKDGHEDDSAEPSSATEPQKPSIRDPVLAHGVDFIKGVAALHLSKS
jgi:hypothetical protein